MRSALLLSLWACATTPAPSAEPAVSAPAPVETSDPWEALAAEARRGVEDPALAEIVEDHWLGQLRRSGETLLSLGYRELWDGSLDPAGPEADAAAAAVRDGLLDRLQAVDLAALAPPDQLTWTLLAHQLRSSQGMDACHEEQWQVSAWRNPLARLTSVVRDARPDDAASGERLLRALGQAPARIEVRTAQLREGIASGRVPARLSAERAVEMMRAELERPTAEWGMTQALEEGGSWGDAGAQVRFGEAFTARVDETLRPALTAFVAFLETELVPASREGADIGVGGLAEGEACYAAAIERHTTLPLTADELHETGLDALERIHAEMEVLGLRELGTADRAELFATLREDPALHFSTRAEVEDFAEQALRDAEAAVPEMFSVTPATPCVVTPVPDVEAPFTYIAYYQPPPSDGSEPGRYYINSWEPTTRPRFSARTLAFHESVPGHHFQIARAKELTDVPAFRRNASMLGVFVEGWALYAERLADEMGLYPSDLDRIGMLTFDAWRAARLVVDTGIHAKGWSRDEAISFMDASTGLAHNNVVNEVDRYIQWPGQALAYKTGQIEIFALRAEAEQALGEAFDIRAFHEVVLGAGPVTLPLLRARVRAWVQEVSSTGVDGGPTGPPG